MVAVFRVFKLKPFGFRIEMGVVFLLFKLKPFGLVLILKGLNLNRRVAIADTVNPEWG